MIKHKQLNKHNPEKGIWGDCDRTCLACLLDLPVEKVPHFFHEFKDGAVDKREKWLNKRGLTSIQLPHTADSVESILNHAAAYINCHYMLIGESKSGTNHVVICYGNKIIHDPSQDGSGIIRPCDDGYYWLMFLAKTL